MFQLQRYPVPPNGKMNGKYEPIELKLNNLLQIPCYRPVWWREDAKHAIRVRTYKNIRDILNEEQNSVVIIVSLKHGLTSLTKVFNHEYSDLTQIKDNKFSYGTKFGVLN